MMLKDEALAKEADRAFCSKPVGVEKKTTEAGELSHRHPYLYSNKKF
tara:strand:- start:7032 stop:7172 length:141 start_codon:yes stop_codon:yes gene_type:complete